VGGVTPPVGSPASVSSPPESIPAAPANERRGGAEPEPDPNEPRYCICNQVAFGTMVACDNKSVSIPQHTNYNISYLFIHLCNTGRMILVEP
jgi:hypothetical protein